MFVVDPFLPMMFTIECVVVHEIWVHSPISFKHMSLWRMCLWRSPNHTPIEFRCRIQEKVTEWHPYILMSTCRLVVFTRFLPRFLHGPYIKLTIQWRAVLILYSLQRARVFWLSQTWCFNYLIYGRTATKLQQTKPGLYLKVLPFLLKVRSFSSIHCYFSLVLQASYIHR